MNVGDMRKEQFTGALMAECDALQRRRNEAPSRKHAADEDDIAMRATMMQ